MGMKFVIGFMLIVIVVIAGAVVYKEKIQDRLDIKQSGSSTAAGSGVEEGETPGVSGEVEQTTAETTEAGSGQEETARTTVNIDDIPSTPKSDNIISKSRSKYYEGRDDDYEVQTRTASTGSTQKQDKLPLTCNYDFECDDTVKCTTETCKQPGTRWARCNFFIKSSCAKEDRSGLPEVCEDLYGYCKKVCVTEECLNKCWVRYKDCKNYFSIWYTDDLLNPSSSLEGGLPDGVSEACAEMIEEKCEDNCFHGDDNCVPDCYIAFCNTVVSGGKTCYEVDTDCKAECSEYLSNTCYNRCIAQYDDCAEYFWG